MKRSLARAALIVAAGAVLGLLWNTVAASGLPLRAHAFLEPGDQEVSPSDARARQEKGATVLDARGIEFYEMGHVTGALPLPEEDFDRAFAALEPRLRGALDVVVYCAGFGCEASHIVARKLKERGIPAVVLAEGWPAWQDAGYPTKEGREP